MISGFSGLTQISGLGGGFPEFIAVPLGIHRSRADPDPLLLSPLAQLALYLLFNLFGDFVPVFVFLIGFFQPVLDALADFLLCFEADISLE